ncbi:MAG TPA: tetratricopeptide repeat protein [Gemmatimonadales bacterium]|nr:tetratricopeptide repeat protein [Gemmatimonadales bacterium]
MALSEIEKLERRYAENPNGLTFAPLAEVHRKNGDVQRALDLLKPGLQNHPDYIPASIVLGRCHLDRGDLPAAETAFTHVLALDGENVIALKALADINERLHRFDDAERWLNTLLSLDRSNEEARDQLTRLEQARRSTAAGAAAPGAEEAALSEPMVASDASTVEPEVSLTSTTAAWIAQPEPRATGDATPLALEELEPAPLEEIERPAGLVSAESLLDEEPVEPLMGMVGQETDEPGPIADEFRVETSEEIVLQSSGGAEFQMPDASQELFGRARDASPFAEPPPPPPPPPSAPAEHAATATEPESEPAVAGGGDSSLLDYAPVLIEAAGMVPPRDEEPAPQAASTPEPALAAPAPEPEPVTSAAPEPELAPLDVTEALTMEYEAPAAPAPDLESELEPTMESVPPAEAPVPAVEAPPAPAEPVRAYRPPEPEPVVTETMAEVLLQQGHLAEALGVYRELAGRSGDPRLVQRVADLESAQAPPPVTRYAAADTGGRSVGDTLRDLLGQRLSPAASAPPVRQSQPAGDEGAPTRPAAEALTLSSVFGEETPASPPAVPSAPVERERVSFDDFYGASNPTQAPRGPRAGEPKSDDLDEFHTWLQNLKR